jgi:hypothetical protein
MFLFRRNFSIIREQEKGDMVVMDFLLNLKPDLNPIENLWEHLKLGHLEWLRWRVVARSSSLAGEAILNGFFDHLVDIRKPDFRFGFHEV